MQCSAFPYVFQCYLKQVNLKFIFVSNNNNVEVLLSYNLTAEIQYEFGFFF